MIWELRDSNEERSAHQLRPSPHLIRSYHTVCEGVPEHLPVSQAYLGPCLPNRTDSCERVPLRGSTMSLTN